MILLRSAAPDWLPAFLIPASRSIVMSYLFTVIAFFVVVGVALFANRQQWFSTDNIQVTAKQIRQELRVVAYLLAAIVILLGVIADRTH